MPQTTRHLEICKLSPAGQLLVWAARSWVQSFMTGCMLPVDVRQRLQTDMPSRAWCELSELLGLLVPRNLDPGGFAADGAALLEPSESALLKLLRIDTTLLDAAGVAAPGMPPAIRREADRNGARLVDAVRLAGYGVEIDGMQRKGPPARASRRPGYEPVLEIGLI